LTDRHLGHVAFSLRARPFADPFFVCVQRPSRSFRVMRRPAWRECGICARPPGSDPVFDPCHKSPASAHLE
jgi:hypothetical protein